VNLRTGPGLDYSILEVLPPGEAITVNGELASRDWYKVVAADQRAGWLAAAYVTLSTHAEVPVVAAPAAPPATPTPARQADQPQTAAAVNVGQVTAIGDSVMLGAAPALYRAISGIEVDAVVGRQVYTGISDLQSRRASGRLGAEVVIHLGTNGTFTSGEFDQIMSVLSGVRRVVFVNDKADRSWIAGNNAVISAGVSRYGAARLVDWYDDTISSPQLFYGDGIHLQPAGQTLYANLIAGAL
jgi:hypothetical protein